MSGFQTSVAYNQAPAVEGDFASTNPRATVLAGPGALLCGAAGVTVGRFAWTSYENVDYDGAAGIVDNFGTGAVTGFVHREQQGLIQVYLEEASMVVPGGFPITLFMEGDFWVKNNGSGQALPGMKAYANYADGKATFAATASPSGATTSAGSIAAATSSTTGSIAGNILTVTAVGSGVVYPGTTISGTSVASGTKVVEQLSGTAGGVGTYAVSIPEQTVASTTISGTYGVFTAGGTIVGTFGVGNTLTGSGISATTVITQQLTGTTGGAGTYAVDVNTVVSSTAITSATNVETKWYCRSSGLAGELVKISSYPQG